MSKPKTAHICLNLTSSLEWLELLQYDVKKGDFVHLDAEAVMFEPQTRDYLDEEEMFRLTLKRLYERNKIPFKSPTNLVLPSFFTRQYTLPEDLLGEDLAPILTSEAERFYVFKKVDPSIGFCTLWMSSTKETEILYTAYPKQALEMIKRTFKELRIPLTNIDCNYTATLRGLVAMAVPQHEVEQQLKWGLIIVGDFNLFMAILDGNMIEKTLETPLPIQDTGEVELLKEMSDDFRQFFGFEVLNRIVVVSNTRKLTTTGLLDTIGFQGATDVFDQNSDTLTSLGAQEAPFPCSLEAIGGALAPVVSEIPVLELNDLKAIETQIDEEQSDLIGYIALGLGVLLLLCQFGITFLLNSVTAQEQKAGEGLKAEIQTYLNSISVAPDLKRKLYIKQTIFQNYAMNNLVIKIDKSLPPEAWLDKVEIKLSILGASDNSASPPKSPTVKIAGQILSADPLSAYVKDLNTDLASQPLSLDVLPKQSDEKRYFEFTLSNDASKAGAGR
jgi:hypothetical protein